MAPLDPAALRSHADPSVARLADEVIAAQERLAARLAVLAGAPTHMVRTEGGHFHRLGPAPLAAEGR